MGREEEEEEERGEDEEVDDEFNCVSISSASFLIASMRERREEGEEKGAKG